MANPATPQCGDFGTSLHLLFPPRFLRQVIGCPFFDSSLFFFRRRVARGGTTMARVTVCNLLFPYFASFAIEGNCK